jgi:large repetitive protein
MNGLGDLAIMFSDHTVHRVFSKRLYFLVVVCVINIVFSFLVVGRVLASDAPSLEKRNNYHRPNAGLNTTTTVTSSQNPSAFGQVITLTATIDAGALVTVTSGVVTFTIDSTVVTSTILPGAPAIAEYTTSALSVNVHTVHVDYADQTQSFNPSSNDLLLGQTVNKADTTTGLAASHTTSEFGETVSFTATVSVLSPGAGTPTGTVQLYDNGLALGAAQPLVNGVASFVTTTLAVGTHPLTATYGSDVNFKASTSSVVTQTVTQGNTTTGLTTAPSPSVYGQSVTITATVNAVAPAAGIPTGTVQFKDNSVNLGSAATLAGGQASITTAALSVGVHTLTADYSGNGDFTASSGTLSPSQTVTRATTSILLSSSPNPSTFNQSVNFTATVLAASPGTGIPTGTVLFKYDGNTIGGAVPLTGGIVSISTSTLPAGSRAITAEYSGDGNFNPNIGLLSSNQIVNKAATLATIIGVAPNPSVVGQSVTVTFTVLANSPFGGIPTGNVSVTVGASSCIGTVSAGNCQINLMTAGAVALTATYLGDNNFSPSPPTLGIAHTVNKASTTATITGNTPNVSVVGQPVTITYSVGVTSPGSGTPTGNVLVSNGTDSCTGTVSSSQCQIAFTLAGITTLNATFQGDTNFDPSAPSTGITQTVNKRDTTPTVFTSINPSVYGQSTTISTTVLAVPPGAGTPTGSVQFKVDGNNLGSPINLSGGSAGISTATLSVGAHTIAAVYSGDATSNPSTANMFPNQVVNKANTTTTILSHTPNPALINQSVTVQFTVTASAPGIGLPTGNVTVTDGIASCTGKVSDGNCQISFTMPGSKMLTAHYGGDNNFNASTSAAVNHSIGSPFVYLPLIMNGLGPKPGAWKGPTNDQFNVSPDSNFIQGFAIVINVSACNITNYMITHTTTEPIVNNHFSFTGSFYADVTFDSPTTAHGYDGLNNYTIPGCGTGSGGPWNFTATWQSNIPIPFKPASGAGPNTTEPALPFDGPQKSISVK